LTKPENPGATTFDPLYVVVSAVACSINCFNSARNDFLVVIVFQKRWTVFSVVVFIIGQIEQGREVMRMPRWRRSMALRCSLMALMWVARSSSLRANTPDIWIDSFIGKVTQMVSNATCSPPPVVHPW
jgi:hypothetical protein